MSRAPREAPAPSYHRECLLPSAARTPSVTQVTPAKKITFFKRGDPRFSGVRLAVHQRTFKSLGALMDELSQRVPLPFGVRAVTTPGGRHDLRALEQLEDGGCYLCSDRKPPGPRRRGTPSAQRPQDAAEGQDPAPGTPSPRENPEARRRVVLVKNGDPRFQQTVVLSHRNTRSLSAFLSKASDLLHFPVKQLYTPSGKKVTSLKTLLHSPSVLLCAGHEAFRTPVMEGAGRSGTEPLSGQMSRNKSGSWGPKAKRSVIHSRPTSGSRRRPFAWPSERSGLSDPAASPPPAWMDPAPDRPPQDAPAQLGPLVAGDDVEKKVRLNEDGSLSVQMKVRFHLVGNDRRLWSGPVAQAGGAGPALGDRDPLLCVWEGPGAQAPGTPEAGCKEALEPGRWQPGSGYQIWTNPLCTAQTERAASGRRSRPAQHSRPGGPGGQGAASGERRGEDSASPASSDRSPRGSEPNSSCGSRAPGSSAGCCGPHLTSETASQSGSGWQAGSAPRAGEGPGPRRRGPGSRTRHGAGAPADSSASAGSHEASSDTGGRGRGRPRKTRAVPSPRKATRRRRPSSSTTNPSSLRNEDPQAEASDQGTRHPSARDEPHVRPPPASGRFGSGDTGEASPRFSTCASATGRRREQESRASAMSLPGVSALRRGPQGDARRPLLGPSGLGGGCPADPAPCFSGSSSSGRNRVPRATGPPASASLHSQDAQSVSSAPVTPASDAARAPSLGPPFSPSAETEGGPELRTHSLSSTPDPCSSRADGPGKKAEGDVAKPSRPLLLPVGQREAGTPGAHQGGCHSQAGTSRVCRTPGGVTQALQASPSRGSPGPLSETCLVGSRYCPAPPRARPSVTKHPWSRSSGHGDRGADGGPGVAEPAEKQRAEKRPQPPSSQSGGTGTAVRAGARGSPSPGPPPGRMAQRQVAAGGEGPEEEGAGGSVMPGALPRASPEAVVCEWLSSIPQETVPMRDEMAGDGAGGGPDGPPESPVDERSPTQARRPSLEGATGETAEAEGALPMPGHAGARAGDGLPCSVASEAPLEAGAEAAVGDRGAGERVLPCGASVSVQILKALMGCEQGRPSSLPEVSGPAGRRLRHSAQALISCLASLHFFHEDLGSPAGKARFTDAPRCRELPAAFQALWPGRGLGQGGRDWGLPELGRCQALPGLGSLAVTEDFTPTSSSGVDVGSGSGGSGEGSGPCAVDCALVPERVELPLDTCSRRPDSRASENPLEPGNQQPGGPTASPDSRARACAARKDAAGGGGGGPTLGRDLDQAAEDTVQGEMVRSEKTEEEERAELRGQGARGLPEEEGPAQRRREAPGAGSPSGQGAPGVESVRAEAAGRDPACSVLCPPGTLGILAERDSDAGGSQSGPIAEPGSETLPRAAGETGSRPAPPGSPGPAWAARLLRKAEAAFLAHLASAAAELRARWGLQGDALSDQMAAELQQDVARRLRDSVDTALRGLQRRAGGEGPQPPQAARGRETLLQTRRRGPRLRGLRHLSAFSQRTRVRDTPSGSLEDGPSLSGALGTWPGGEAAGEEFCPCEACARRKAIPVSPEGTVGVASAPIKEAFDLQHILQKKKGGGAREGRAGTEPLQRDPSGPRAVQGAEEGGLEPGLGRGPGPEEGHEEGGSQSLGRGDALGRDEEKTGGDTEPRVGHHPEAAEWAEPGVGDKEANTERGSGAEVGVETEAVGRADGSPGRQGDGADTVETGETEGEGQPELQAGPRQSSPGPDGRPAPPAVPGRDPPGQRSGRTAGLPWAGMSPLGNGSQLSQKGSEEEPSNGDQRAFGPEPQGAPGPERKAAGMYPDSSASDHGGSSRGSGTPEPGADGGGWTAEPRAGRASDPGAEAVAGSQETRFRNLATDRTHGFGQDDLDF